MNLPDVLADRIRSGLDCRPVPGIVAICGWADTGKSTIARQLARRLDDFGLRASAVSTDAFMKDRAEREALGLTGYDPRAIDAHALVAAADRYRARESFSHHPYDNRSGTKQPQPVVVPPGDVLVVEGIHAFHVALADRLDLKVFIDADEATLRDLRFHANWHKRGLSATDAAARIQREWDDFAALVRPDAATADVVVEVDRAYRYRLTAA